MNGGPVTPAQVDALGHWLNALPALPAPPHAPADDPLVARGAELFHDPAVGCVTCHASPLFTNNARVSLTMDPRGTQGFKVPSLLGVIWRPPYMHDGCAATLLDRFTTPCGGGDYHGHTSQLGAGDLNAFVAYLGSL